MQARVLYEGELGIVIGKQGKDIALDQAVDYIFGYTCVNDVTALDLLKADLSFAQWTRAKSFDCFGPFGPVIATSVDPAELVVRTLVNGKERQNYAVHDMIFPPAQLVSLISRDMTLLPGDVALLRDWDLPRKAETVPITGRIRCAQPIGYLVVPTMSSAPTW